MCFLFLQKSQKRLQCVNTNIAIRVYKIKHWGVARIKLATSHVKRENLTIRPNTQIVVIKEKTHDQGLIDQELQVYQSSQFLILSMTTTRHLKFIPVYN